MFQALVESGPRAPVGARRYLLSFGIHLLVIVAAVLGTRRSMVVARSRPIELVLPVIVPATDPVSPAPAGPLLPPRVPAVPSEWPPITEVPVLDPLVLGDGTPSVTDVLGEADSRSGYAVDLSRLGRGDSLLLPPAGALTAAAVDEPVAIIRQHMPRYPAALARARLTGRVEVSYVVDTTGQAEPGSLRVLATSHPEFEAAARTSIIASRYRPAKLHGRAVRQLVRQTLSFKLGE